MIYDGSIKAADYAEEAADLAVEKLLNSAGGYENAMKAEALRILQAKTMNEILHPKTPVVPVVVPGSTGVQVIETVPVDPAVIVDPTEGEIVALPLEPVVPVPVVAPAAAEEPATVVVPERAITVDTQNGNTIVTDTQSKTTVVL